jgi:hypothetical protein
MQDFLPEALRSVADARRHAVAWFGFGKMEKQKGQLVRVGLLLKLVANQGLEPRTCGL